MNNIKLQRAEGGEQGTRQEMCASVVDIDDDDNDDVAAAVSAATADKT